MTKKSIAKKLKRNAYLIGSLSQQEQPFLLLIICELDYKNGTVSLQKAWHAACLIRCFKSKKWLKSSEETYDIQKHVHI